MRNGMRMALVMAFMVGCLPSGALARSSDPPEPVLWEDPAIVNNSSGIDENSSSDVSTSEEYGPRFIEVLRDDSFIYLMDRKTAHYRKVPHLAKERMIDVWIKLEPLEGEFLRREYEDIIPGYYMNKVHWNSVKVSGSVPDDVVRDMLDHAYDVVLRSFSKKKQKEILEGTKE